MHSTGHYIQSLGADHDGREYEKKSVCVCMYIRMYNTGHYAIQLKLTQHCKSTILRKKKDENVPPPKKKKEGPGIQDTSHIPTVN